MIMLLLSGPERLCTGTFRCVTKELEFRKKQILDKKIVVPFQIR